MLLALGPGHLPASDDPTLGKITFGELFEVFTEQARGLVEGGADLIIVETAQDILEVKASIFGAREAFAEFDLEGRSHAVAGAAAGLFCVRRDHRRMVGDSK